MEKSHDIEILDIRYHGCFKTGHGAKGADYAETRQLFEKARTLACKDARAAFCVDLHDPAGNIVDSVLIDSEAFTKLTGEKVMSHAEAKAYDAEFWANARKTAARMREELS